MEDIKSLECINKLEKLIGESFLESKNLTNEKTIQALHLIANFKKEWALKNESNIDYKSPYLIIPGTYCNPVAISFSELGLDQ